MYVFDRSSTPRIRCQSHGSWTLRTINRDDILILDDFSRYTNSQHRADYSFSSFLNIFICEKWTRRARARPAVHMTNYLKGTQIYNETKLQLSVCDIDQPAHRLHARPKKNENFPFTLTLLYCSTRHFVRIFVVVVSIALQSVSVCYPSA